MRNILLMMIIAAMLVSCSSDGPKKVKLERGEKVVASFANGNPQVVRELKEIDGKMEAVYEKEYYDDGNLLKEGAIMNNKRHGEWKSFYRKGNLWSVGNFDNGVRTDSIVGYYPNGALKYRGFYKDGQKSGTWELFDENGNYTEKKVYMQPGEVREEQLTIPGK
jgi:antitoxin component YwqK of YwqJK toxin-antitoxin module